MSEQPLVSIAIPAFNADFFQATLVSALGQDYPNLEIVICDDSAGVEIEAICQTLGKGTAVPVRYTRNPVRLGFARNLQACLEQANGVW